MRFLLWLRKSKLNQAGTAPVMLRVFLDTHTRAEHATGIRCRPDEWGKQGLKPSAPGADGFNRTLRSLVAKATLKAETLQNTRPDTEPPVTPAEVVAALCERPAPAPPKPKLLLPLLTDAIPIYYDSKPSTKPSIILAVQWLAKWPGAAGLTLPDLTPSRAQAFATWLALQPLTAVTRSSYVGNLSSLLSRAAPDHPRVFTKLARLSGGGSKPRRALTVEWLRKLQALPLRGLEALSRDLFMLQFFLHGSRVAAVIVLQKSQVDWQANRVRFTAMKVTRHKDIELRPEIRELLCRYQHNPTPFVLPLLPADYLSRTPTERHRALTLARMSMRSALSRVGKKLGWPGSLHSHLARHSLALRAYQQSQDLQLVQGMLGHESVSQSAAYIESINPQRLDAGAASVYDSLL